ncbi:dual specificity protein kinase lkh1 [Podospora fimiseda]|uniref:dual-specificity kinase n=1 Tax=Podospora fimiseda TaxID=252190 RepID=A0AAN7H7U3_9PEZI|nr:dual specificity protein kinase lkh1 [Podospora fimiseda]
MSTPTTATALPHYNHPHHYYNNHHHSHQYPQPNPPSFRTAPAPLLPSRGLPVYASLPSPVSYPASSTTLSASDGVPFLTSETSRPLPQHSAELSSRSESLYTAMPAGSQSSQALPEPPRPTRKRRREGGPDWQKFYERGLPKEIIVIEDTPPPSAATNGSSQNPTNGGPSQNPTNGHSHVIRGPGADEDHPPPKRRRREDQYDPVYHNIAPSNTQTPLQYGSPSQSTVSTDRTNSALNTSAATSLGSNSTHGHNDNEAAVAGQKRKRTTRQQTANEARRREAQTEDVFPDYQPPALPIQKAKEVRVQVLHDTADHAFFTQPPQSRNVRVDDEEGHYIVVPDNDLTDRYQMIKLLGQGTFGKVVQARDKRRNKLVAIKIIRSVQKYREASKIELRVLETLKMNDAANRNRCIHLRDCFDYRGHICIVMDLLGQSVFDFLKSNNFVPFPNSQIQSFARQLLTSVAFLHDLNLIHTDLKPENILLCHNEYQTFTYNRKIPSSSSNVSRQATQRRVLLDTEIRLIDFGSATFQDEYHSSVVSTRHYRAPEIILGLGWSYPCDIWSIGCILVEFYTGDALFQTHDNLEHLAMMEAVVDSRIDSSLVQQVTRSTRNGGNPAAKFFKRQKLDYPTSETTRASRRFVKAMKKLQDIIPPNNTFLAQFLDLLKKIFVYDPAQRITAKQALNHPWFKERMTPDDGTEAARIRHEKFKLLQQNSSGSRSSGSTC